MTNPLTAARQALLARLQSISPDNGYLTGAGANVKSGWVNEILQERHHSFPLIVVQPDKSTRQPEAMGGGDITIPMAFNVVGAVQVGIDYEQAIDDLTLDLARCLLSQDLGPLSWGSPGMHSVAIAAPEIFPPGDGLAVATVLVRVEFSILTD
ncbi:hypothetical protein ACFOJE_21190 [Azotobacter bryophylli]|uniref:Tail terminator n=1 Tax=Azotobacter bryophylli TaxID=1986537 RepID=A0ABV7B1E4_9GAMM